MKHVIPVVGLTCNSLFCIKNLLTVRAASCKLANLSVFYEMAYASAATVNKLQRNVVTCVT